jgi:glycosyltransferase involved in cell wall biosynthesis
MYDMGAFFLKESFDQLLKQTNTSFEVVVSDQSTNDQVRNLCAEYNRYFPIVYVSGANVPRSASSNVNNAITHARSDVVKILFQDDFFVEPEAISLISASFENNTVNWVLNGCCHTYDGNTLIRPMVPSYHPSIHLGRNTISSPSVLAFRRNAAPRFDGCLIWLMDVEFYRHCFDVLGVPTIIPAPLIANRLHKAQVSTGISKAKKIEELMYVRKKYRNSENIRNKWDYLRELLKLRREKF